MITFLIGLNSQLLGTLSFSVFELTLFAASTRGLQSMAIGLGLALAVILTALFCGLVFFSRCRKGREIHNHKSMLRELSRAHNLTGSEHRLLKRLATGLDLPCPSALFIDSTLWRLPDGSERRARLSKTDWDKLLKLQRTLFLPPPAKLGP